MTTGRASRTDEYLGEEKALMSLENAPRLPGAFATDRLVTDHRGDFSLGGHRLSSLYRRGHDLVYWLNNRYVPAFSSPKYSNSTEAGVTAPGNYAW
jgi:hypothetical protein